MASRERNFAVTGEEWFGTGYEDKTATAFRAKTMKEARTVARRHLACVSIVVKSRFGSRVMSRHDARYWMWDEKNDVDRPPPSFEDVKKSRERAERTKRLNPPRGLFG